LDWTAHAADREPLHRGGNAGVDRAVAIRVIQPHPVTAIARRSPRARPGSGDAIFVADASRLARQRFDAVFAEAGDAQAMAHVRVMYSVRAARGLRSRR